LQSCNGISVLPEWLGDLSSLKSLGIYECDGIKSFPACIQRLTKLQKLYISDNQELRKWCESEENKTKLAHLNVQVSLLTNCGKYNVSLSVFSYTTSIYVQLFSSVISECVGTLQMARRTKLQQYFFLVAESRKK